MTDPVRGRYIKPASGNAPDEPPEFAGSMGASRRLQGDAKVA
ncbi:hypothetical protein ACQ3G6_15140 [Allorhizobium undicola]|nr:hypothetical protein [Allorhizobium undicola]